MRQRDAIIGIGRICCLAALGFAMQCGPRVASATTLAVDDAGFRSLAIPGAASRWVRFAARRADSLLQIVNPRPELDDGF